MLVSADKRDRDPGLGSDLVLRIKICGLRDPTLACKIILAGAHAIGLMFYAPSPRCITLSQAEEIRSNLPQHARTVGVVVNPSEKEVTEIVKRVSPSLLQFHGNESEEFCRSFDVPYIKAIPTRSREYIQRQAEQYHSANALMLDTYSPEHYGGSGKRFDYSMIPDQLPLPLILAGGLAAENVGNAIQQVRPYAVDVSSGVESAPGKKDFNMIKRFILATQQK